MVSADPLAAAGLLEDAGALFGRLMAAAPVHLGVARIAPALDGMGDALTAKELPPGRRLAAKRRREIIAGRLLARRVLWQMGLRPGAIVAREDRSPIWPQGLVGSITHSDGLCAVAIARAEQVSELGIDVEPDGPVRRELWARIARPDERLAAGDEALAGEEEGRRVRLLFSAKEAYYKAQFPRTGQVLWHQEVRIDLDEPHFRASLSAIGAGAAPEPGAGMIDRGLGHLSTSWLVRA